ncbi:hydrolase [Planctomycetaceae bacterium SCGC AG-212-F19]|nr:hydrolase [Planctomycetaceae bacterium SCGC AG-212-F19]
MRGTRTFTFLGTGTSTGVPMIGCSCGTCTSANLKNHRYRTSVLIGTQQGNILIDTPPELRLALLREKVGMVHGVLFTHYHADHLFGLDDIRPMCHRLNGPMPLYCTAQVEQKIRETFSYAFKADTQQMPVGYVPRMGFHRIAEQPFTVLGEEVVPVPLIHSTFDVLGFRIDDVAYCTDVNKIPDASWRLLEGVRVLVLDALRDRPHPAHFSLDEALGVIAELRPARAYLTHMGHELEHEATNRRLPPNVELAYDGLKFSF